MASSKVDLDKAAAEIVAVLTTYGDDVREGVNTAIDTTAAELVATLKKTSPNDGINRSPKYYKGWKKTVVYSDATQKRVKVRNSTAYALTHLLEKGHILKTAKGVVIGFVKAKPHIADPAATAEENLENRIKELL